MIRLKWSASMMRTRSPHLGLADQPVDVAADLAVEALPVEDAGQAVGRRHALQAVIVLISDDMRTDRKIR